MPGLKAGSVLLVLRRAGLAVVILAPLARPSASFFSTRQVQEAEPIDFLQHYIPATPFSAMVNAVVPAIIVFSILKVCLNSKRIVGMSITPLPTIEWILFCLMSGERNSLQVNAQWASSSFMAITTRAT